jgi:hypothetical protein
MPTPLRLVAVIAFFALGASTVTAQDGAVVRAPTPVATDCPVDFACVAYRDALIAIDPTCGPVQAVIVRESLSRTADIIDGTEEHWGLRGVVVAKEARDPDSAMPPDWKVVAEFSEPATGALDGVRLEWTGCLAWEAPDA